MLIQISKAYLTHNIGAVAAGSCRHLRVVVRYGLSYPAGQNAPRPQENKGAWSGSVDKAYALGPMATI